MKNRSEPTLVGDIILVRLLASTKKPPSRSEIKKSVAPFFEHCRTAGEWNDLFETAWQQLLTEEAITTKPVQLTETGHSRALGFLGLQEAPVRVTWSTLKNTYLVARALDASAESEKDRRQLASADGLRALVLKQEYDLNLDGCPTLNQAIDALTWRQIGVETDRALTAKAVIEELLGRLLHLHRKLEKEQILKQLPAGALAASKTDAGHLRLTAIRRWLNSQGASSDRNGQSDVPDDLRSFAEQVREAAANCQTGQFGAHKVFIGHVWRHLKQQWMSQNMDLAAFKQRLAEANHQGLLTLSRADLVEAMNPDDIAESETKYLNAVFHFIQI